MKDKELKFIARQKKIVFLIFFSFAYLVEFFLINCTIKRSFKSKTIVAANLVYDHYVGQHRYRTRKSTLRGAEILHR